MINLELYRIFYYVAREGNITKASETLKISQPAVTKHIKNLEEQLDCPLFIRTKKGVVLTESGQKLYLDVRNALNIIDNCEKEISKYKDLNIGTVRIGISRILMETFFFKYLNKFHEEYPNVIIDVINAPTKNLIIDLKNGLIDIIIAKTPNNEDLELDYKILGRSEYVFVAGKKYKQLKSKKINILALSDYPLIFPKSPSNSLDKLNEYLKNQNIKLKPVMNIASTSLLQEFVINGYGIGFTTLLYAKNDIDNGNLFKLNIEPKLDYIDFGIITLKGSVQNAVVSKLIELINNDML